MLSLPSLDVLKLRGRFRGSGWRQVGSSRESSGEKDGTMWLKAGSSSDSPVL